MNPSSSSPPMLNSSPVINEEGQKKVPQVLSSAQGQNQAWRSMGLLQPNSRHKRILNSETSFILVPVKRVYTKWIQYKIKKFDPNLVPEMDASALVETMSDGLVLHRLMRALTKKMLPITEEELIKAKGNQIKLQSALNKLIAFTKSSIVECQSQAASITCSSQHFIEKNTAQVMGMIWVIILAYQGIKKDKQVKWAKKGLGEIPGLQISADLAASFQDGMAFAYLINSFKADVINIEKIMKMEIRQRLDTIFERAEQYFGIPRLLEPADCYPEKPNENSMMIYLSFFHNVSRVERGEITSLDAVVPLTPSEPTLEIPPPGSPSSLTSLKAEIEKLRSQLARLTAASSGYGAADSRIKELEAELRQLKKWDIPDLRYEMELKDKEIKRLKDVSKQRDSLNDELEAAKSELAKSMTAQGELAKQKDQLASQVEELEQKLIQSSGATDSRIKELEAELRQLKKWDIPDLRYELELKDKEIERLKESAADSSADAASFHEQLFKLALLESELDRCKDIEAIQRGEIFHLKFHVQDLETEVEQLSERLNQSEAKLKVFQEEIASKDAVITQLEERVKELSASGESASDKLTSELKDITEQRDSLNDELEAAKSELDHSMMAQGELAKQKDQLTSQVEELEQKLIQSTKKQQESDKSISELRQQLKEAQEAKGEAESRLSELESKSRELENDIHAKKSLINDVESKLAAAEAQLKSALDSKLSEIDSSVVSNSSKQFSVVSIKYGDKAQRLVCVKVATTLKEFLDQVHTSTTVVGTAFDIDIWDPEIDEFVILDSWELLPSSGPVKLRARLKQTPVSSSSAAVSEFVRPFPWQFPASILKGNANWKSLGYSSTPYKALLVKDGSLLRDRLAWADCLKWINVCMASAPLENVFQRLHQVYAIQNELQDSIFTASIRQLLNKHRASPHLFRLDGWKRHPDASKRQAILDSYTTLVDLCANDWNLENGNAPVVPMLQGTSEKAAWEIAQQGLSTVGKPANDSGWYGNGVYTTSCLPYALSYASELAQPPTTGPKVVLLTMVSPGNIYPVTEAPNSSESLLGKPQVPGYQSHYVRVKSSGSQKGYPCSSSDLSSSYDELVTFDNAQTLVKYILFFDGPAAKTW